MNLHNHLNFFGLTKYRLTVFVALSITTAFFEGFGITMFLPVLEFIEKGKDVLLLQQTGGMWLIIIKGLNFVGLELTLLALLVVAMTAMLIRVLMMYARQIYTGWLTQTILHTVRTNLYKIYMKMDYGVYASLSSGKIINLLTTETRQAGGSLGAIRIGTRQPGLQSQGLAQMYAHETE